ncbi:uncharacterized protein LOC143859397 [Tasmannia lanceolata]|uniref:uncharacterized protein LOC143859397 n=1 Tax=Tasmannia lanceolata TaxID=3420 RepID=UPI004062E68A
MKSPSKPSGAFRSILKARETVKEKICYIVGKESEIDYWTQPWHSDGIIEHKFSKTGSDYSLSSVKSLDEIHRHSSWNPILNKPSLKEEKIFLRKALFHEECSNKVILKPAVDGEFSVKSGWDNVRSKHSKVPWAKTIWFVGHIPRHALIAWKAIQGKLLTRDHLIFKNISIDEKCPLCKAERESINDPSSLNVGTPPGYGGLFSGIMEPVEKRSALLITKKNGSEMKEEDEVNMPLVLELLLLLLFTTCGEKGINESLKTNQLIIPLF